MNLQSHPYKAPRKAPTHSLARKTYSSACQAASWSDSAARKTVKTHRYLESQDVDNVSLSGNGGVLFDGMLGSVAQPGKYQTRFQGVAWVGGECSFLERKIRTSYRKGLVYNGSQLVLHCFIHLRQMAQ